MAATTHQNGLSADDRSDIRSTILRTRATLEEEFERQLERYGIYDDDRVPVSSLTHLSVEDIATRKEIDAALERELEATDGLYGRAYRNYVREATKEYLNRLVGLKTIEARELVTETLRTRPEYGGRSYMHYTVDEVAGELTDAPDDGLGVALDLAYQEIGSEIRVLFDGSDYTALEPDFAVRREILEELDELGDDVWQSDEAMGWVYQYFGENEREEIDERIDSENYKVQDTDVATKTQLFTPRYIVEWMVDNSLGRLWLEMHGDETNIDDEDKCFYLAPLEESLFDRDVKDVQEIKVLDPACGSGHMLIYAFDVLYEMYLDQGDVPKAHIPREILKNNLYGIDIDEGAAQIAALSLYVKAKSRSPDVAIEGMNIVSANAVLVNGEKKEEVLDRADTELEKRVLEQVWTSFEHIREWGSLVRIEEQIEEIIDEELKEVKATGQTQFTKEGLAKQSSVMSFSGEEESWQQIKERLLEQVAELAEEALEQNDPIEEMFAGEVEKSVRVLDLLIENYDSVITNPPYLYRDKMGSKLSDFLKDNYSGSSDTYTAFIERATELAGDDNYVSMVTMETFMFLYSYRKMRAELLEKANFVDAAHLEHRDEGYMNICFTLRSKGDPKDKTSRFIQLTGSNKEEEDLRELTNVCRDGSDHEDIYTADQKAFKEIDRTPIIYWFGNEILQLFINHPNLGEIADVMEGLGTGDDDKYIRNWWEIDEDLIGNRYFWFARSGDGDIYYESYEQTVLWENDGEEIRNYSGSRIGNTDYYGEPGLTFRDFAKHFTARLHEPGHVFSNKAHFVHTGNRNDDYALLGFLSSSLSRFIMNGLNPGLNFKSGDGKRLPVKEDLLDHENIGNLAREGAKIQKNKNKLREWKPDYTPSLFIEKATSLQFYLDICKADVLTIHGLIDEMVFSEFGISDMGRYRVERDLPPNLSQYPHIKNAGELQANRKEFRRKIETSEVSDEEFDEILSRISNMSGDSIRDVSENLSLSPYTVAMARHKHDLYSQDEKRQSAGKILSYFLGVIFGRWDNRKHVSLSGDGILVFDDQFDDNVTDRIRECIEATFDDVYEKEAEIEELLNKDMTDWLRENFFRYHHCKEYRRRGQRIPIYWHLESDDGAFSCFLYYHEMDADTLPKLRGQYVDAKIGTLENRLESIESRLDGADGDRQRELNAELEEVQEQLDDIRDFGERLDELIDDGFEPNFEAGIWENIQKVDEYDLLQTELDKL